jgi:DNA end-binding protein Ku
MAGRAIWTGVLKLESAEIPVKLYAAVQDETVHFHLLEKKTGARVGQHMIDPNTGDEVESGEIRKGYEVESGRFVILSTEDVASADPEESREIVVSRFVPADAMVHQYYDRPYYLGPGGNVKSYFGFAEALEASGREGIAHWTMRKKEYNGALRVHDRYLVLIALRHTGEVVTARDLPDFTGRAPDEREIRMAGQLVETLAGEFNPEDFRDEYRDRVMHLIETKAKGHTPKLRKMPARAKASTSLVDVLSASLKDARKGKGGKKVA